MALVVKFSTLAGGVFIEENGTPERKPEDRCFRFSAGGAAEYAAWGELMSDPDRARWYGHQFRERDFLFA